MHGYSQSLLEFKHGNAKEVVSASLTSVFLLGAQITYKGRIEELLPETIALITRPGHFL